MTFSLIFFLHRQKHAEVALVDLYTVFFFQLTLCFFSRSLAPREQFFSNSGIVPLSFFQLLSFRDF